jgi:parallel beta-helix repeat protein
MSKLNIWQNSRILRLGLAIAFGLALLIGLLLAMGAARPPDVALAQATIRYVAPAPTGNDSGNDCTTSTAPCATVQHAVDVADPDDEIRVATGTYTDVQARTGITQVVYISKTVTIRGGYTTAFTDPPNPEGNPTTLNAQEQGRVLYIRGNISPTIDGFTITGGDISGQGGGIAIYYSSPILSHNIITNNHAAGYGGGIGVSSGSPLLSDNTVISNSVTSYPSYGGGIYVIGRTASPVLSNNQIISNTTSNDGGGIFIDDYSSPTLISNTIASNYAPSDGGGIYIDFHSTPTLINNTIAHNTGRHGSAGIMLYNYVEVTLTGNTIINNTTDYDGGGLSIYLSSAILNSNFISSNTANYGGGLFISSSTVTLTGNIVTANTAQDSPYNGNGGGLYLTNSTATLTNNVVADNQAETAGSGLYILGSSPRLLHTTIARNSGGDGSGFYVTDIRSNYSSVALTNTILVSQTVGVYATNGNTATLEATLWGSESWANETDWGGAGSIATGTVNLWDNPAFVDPNARDYHIGPGSAAIDMGVDAGVTTDIDGDSRDAMPDLGADERAGTGIYLPIILKKLKI